MPIDAARTVLERAAELEAEIRGCAVARPCGGAAGPAPDGCWQSESLDAPAQNAIVPGRQESGSPSGFEASGQKCRSPETHLEPPALRGPLGQDALAPRTVLQRAAQLDDDIRAKSFAQKTRAVEAAEAGPAAGVDWKSESLDALARSSSSPSSPDHQYGEPG